MLDAVAGGWNERSGRDEQKTHAETGDLSFDEVKNHSDVKRDRKHIMRRNTRDEIAARSRERMAE